MHTKIVKTLTTILIMYATSYAAVIFASPSKTYTLGAISFPPLSVYKEGSNECIGKAVEITKFIIERNGDKLTVICAPAARIYKMMEQGKVDLTINVKSTRLLQPHTTFVEPRFKTLNLNFYSYDKEMPLLVSGIRGFDYLGHRQRIEKEGYQFNDLANANDAIEVFLRGRTKALITYEQPFANYLKTKLDNKLPKGITLTEIQTIGTYYGVSKASPSHDAVIELLSDYIVDNGVNEFFPED